MGLGNCYLRLAPNTFVTTYRLLCGMTGDKKDKPVSLPPDPNLSSPTKSLVVHRELIELRHAHQFEAALSCCRTRQIATPRHRQRILQVSIFQTLQASGIHTYLLGPVRRTYIHA